MRTIADLTNTALASHTSASDAPDLIVTRDEYALIMDYFTKLYGPWFRAAEPKDKRMGVWFNGCWATFQPAPPPAPGD